MEGPGKEREGTWGWTNGGNMRGPCVWVPGLLVTKCHASHENIRNSFSWFWRPEVPKHSVGRPVPPLEAQGGSFLAIPAPGGDQPSLASRHVAPGLAIVSTGLPAVSVALNPNFPRLLQSHRRVEAHAHRVDLALDLIIPVKTLL